MNHLLENYATIGSTLDTLCSAMAEKGYPNYVPTADTLWSVYSLVSAVNNGSVPYDPYDNFDSTDFCKGNRFQYGVKAEKVKARKHRKANIQKKNPCKRVKGSWCDEAYDFKRYDKYCKAVSSEKGKRKFRSSQPALLDYDEEVNFIKAEEASAATDYAEYLRIENMSEEEKAQKRAILKDALARYAISRGKMMYEFSTERGTYMFDEDMYGDSFYLFKKEEMEGKEYFISVYAIWDYVDETYFDGDYDKVIEDMVKII